MVSKAAYLYFGYLAWGCLALLPLVSLREVGQGFYRFFGFLCAGLLTLSVGLALFMGPTITGNDRLSVWALGACLFLTLCFTTALKVRVRWFVWTCFVLAVGSGLAALAYFPWQGGPHPLFFFLHSLTSALVLGAGILAMMLGHWYLVIPKLSIDPLKRLSAGYILLSVFTAVKLSVSFFLYVGFGPHPLTPGGEALMGQELIFAIFRVAWGLLAPLGMAYWVWETVRIRSTQSATGILYASMVCTMMGEGMGLFLTLQTGIPF